MGSADAQALQGREQGRSAAAARPGDRAQRAATRTLAVTAGRTMRRDEAVRWQLMRRRGRLERGDGCRGPGVAGAGPHARPERELRARNRARLAGRPAPGPDAGGGRALGADSPYLWRADACGLRAWRSRARKVPRASWIIGTARIHRGQLDERSPPAPAARCGRGGPPRISGTSRGTETAFPVPVGGLARRARPAVEHGRAAIAAGTRRSPAAARHFAALRRP